VAPSPTSAPPDPSSYSAAAAVLFGMHLVGSSAASKAVGLHGDRVVRLPAPGDAMSLWMSQVEAAINTLAPGSVLPLSSTFTQVGKITATATKLKAE
jgi:hypothetical protein